MYYYWLFQLFPEVPKLSDLVKTLEFPESHQKRVLLGGETQALKHFEERLHAEEAAFKANLFQPNQARPNILGPPLTLSAAISFGALSVRL